MVYLFKMVIFHGYVKLPEGNLITPIKIGFYQHWQTINFMLLKLLEIRMNLEHHQHWQTDELWSCIQFISLPPIAWCEKPAYTLVSFGVDLFRCLDISCYDRVFKMDLPNPFGNRKLWLDSFRKFTSIPDFDKHRPSWGDSSFVAFLLSFPMRPVEYTCPWRFM